jgi:Cu(I)/Ag(I) efflux system membrane protein CusA/SilA
VIVILGSLVWRGLGKEFMPPLDEGSYLYMPTTMPHASIGESLDVLQKQDMAINVLPEVYSVVGKLGRAETPLDPAPVSMIDTVINYYTEYLVDEQGRRLRFKYDSGEKDLFRNINGDPVLATDNEPYYVKGKYLRDKDNKLIEDPDGMPFRIWRPALDPDINEDREYWKGIGDPDDIWKSIVKAAEIPGTTSAPRLQPIAARIVMLQSGMRAPMGVKIKGPDLQTIETVGLKIEALLKQLDSIEPASVFADRIVGKPYLEIDINRQAIARYGISISQVQEVIEVALGGKRITTTVEGRERYPVRIRYMRELRDSIEDLGRILVPSSGDAQIPLTELAEIKYTRGPQVIKSEDTFLIGYVLFDKKSGYAEVDVVEQAQEYLSKMADEGKLIIPAGVSYSFAGSYENQVRSEKTLVVVLPLALFIIFMILYFQFRSVVTTSLVFSGIIVAWAGGFLMIWFYGQGWFMDFSLFDVNIRDLFQMHPVNLSVAVWVGFLALFGIASDNGVVVATYLDQSFKSNRPDSVEKIRQATIEAAMRRVRPCLMTTATTFLALIPVLTSTGRGSDIMVPMAIPSYGGMAISIVTILIVPVLYCAVEEMKLSKV